MRILVVGSSVIDVFLEPEDESAFTFHKGTVSFELGDKIPIKITRLGLGGNGANFSVATKRLGIDTTFFTYSGDDILSEEIRKKLTDEGINLLTDTISGNSDLSLIFNFDRDRTIFSHHEYRDHNFHYDLNDEINYIYLTSIGKEWIHAYESVLEFSKNRDIPLAFSPGSHQLKDMNEIFEKTLKSSRMLLMNKSEAQQILEHYEMEENVVENMLKKLKSFGAHIVSITDGADGAYAIDGFDKVYMVKPLPTVSHEKTGAGDSYAAGFMAGILSGQSTPDAMKWGVLDAYSVIQKPGAQNGLLTQESLNMLLSKHPDLVAQELD